MLYEPDVEHLGLLSEIPLSPDNQTLRQHAASKYFVSWLIGGNPVRQFLVHQLMDWFPVNGALVNGSQTMGIFLQEYLDQFLRSALNFSSSRQIQGAQEGTFEYLMHNQTRDGLMLMYLDNRYNTVGKVNENYAREMLELFSLGTVDPITGARNYTEASIMPVARSVTGYSIYQPTGYPTYSWEFVNEFFDNGEKTIFPGTLWEATDNFGHDSLIPYILYNHPGSARYIAGQLFTRIVHPNLSEDLLQELVVKFRDQMGYHIGEYVKMLLKSSAMYSNLAVNGCVAEPFSLGRRYLRNLDLPVDYANHASDTVIDRVDRLGRAAGEGSIMPKSIFGMEGCGVIRGTDIHNGEKFLSLTNTIARMDLINHINRAESYVDYNPDELLSRAGETPAELVDYVDRIFSIHLRPAERSLILETLGESWPADSVQRASRIYGTLWVMMALPRNWLR